MFLIHQGESKEISISLLLGGKTCLDFWFDQFDPTLKRERMGDRSQKFFCLTNFQKNITSELISMAFSVEIQYFCWTKCKNVLSHGISHSGMEQFFILPQLPQLLIRIQQVAQKYPSEPKDAVAMVVFQNLKGVYQKSQEKHLL